MAAPFWFEFDYIFSPMMNLAQLMTSPVITAAPNSRLPALLELMEQHRISAVVLAEADVPLGIVTERDITRRAAMDELHSELTGHALMTGKLVTASADTGYREAFQMMVVSGIRHLVVLDRAGKAAGIVTESDFLHSLGLEYFVELTSISEVVTRSVIALSPSDSVHAALEQMHRHGISCIPIAEHGQPVGILTERDVILLSRKRLDLYHTLLSSAMSSPVHTVPEHATLPDAVAALAKHGIRRLVAVDAQGRMIGILTATDLLKGLQGKYSRLLREIIHEQERQLRETHRVLNEQTILRSLLESAPDTGIAATDLNLRILYFNPVAARIYGYPAEEVVGRTVHEIHVQQQIPPERLDNAVRIVQERGLYEYSVQRHGKGGSRYFEARVSAIRNPSGEMIGYLLMVQDVTPRREAQLALQRSEERLRKSQQFADVGSWDWQIETGILHWSDQMPALFGLPQGKMATCREHFMERVHPEDRQRLADAVRACLEDGADYEIEYRVIWPDKSMRWLHEQGDVVRDEYGDPLNMLGLAQDITRRKEAEMQLQAQHRFLDSVIETIPSMLFVKDAEHLRFVRFNRAGEQLTGRPAADFIGRSDDDLFEPKEAEARLASDRRILTSGKLIEVSEEQLQTRHQGIRLLRTRKAPILDDQGQPAYLLGISDDITEQRAAEQNLAEARIQAEKANQAKSDFLANMSHEIRTPMNGIIGLTELALKTELTLQQADYLNKVNQSAQSLLGLLNDILDLSKIEAHRLELESIPFDLHDLMAQIGMLMSIHSQQKEIPLRIYVDPEIPQHLLGDPLRIKQILLNLVGNAFKFTQQGEISLYVRPGLHAQPGCMPIAFTVRDTGIGISKEHQSALFKPFVQSDSSTTRIYGGTGLGLAITKHLVEMMDGTIDLMSTPGQGSAFTFVLPLSLSDQKRLTEHLERADLHGPDDATLERIRGARILLVEDNKINQQVAVELLTQECFRVDLAENGRQALDLLRPDRYDLILMDLQMPVMDGYQTVAEIRRHEAYDVLPILAMSANAMRHDRELCIAAGMNDHLPKPIDRRRLLSALCNWMRPSGRGRIEPLGNTPPQKKALLGRVPEMPGIDSRAALKRLGGNEGVYLSILRSFAGDHGQDVQEVRMLLDQCERKDAERLAHNLKGMAGAIGAEGLQEAARLLEDGIRKQFPLDRLLNAAEDEQQRVIAALRLLPPEEAAPELSEEPSAADREEICIVLRRLEDRLKKYDAGTADTLEELLGMRLNPDLRRRLLSLKLPIEQFDFETALASLAAFPEFPWDLHS